MKKGTMTEAEFNRYLEERFPTDAKRSTNGIFRSSFGARIADIVRNPTAGDKNIRCYVKKHRFQLLDLPSLGMKDVLIVPRRTDQVLYTMGGSRNSKWSPPLITLPPTLAVSAGCSRQLTYGKLPPRRALGGLLQDHQGGSWQWTASCGLSQDVWEGM